MRVLTIRKKVRNSGINLCEKNRIVKNVFKTRHTTQGALRFQIFWKYKLHTFGVNKKNHKFGASFIYEKRWEWWNAKQTIINYSNVKWCFQVHSSSSREISNCTWKLNKKKKSQHCNDTHNFEFILFALFKYSNVYKRAMK